MRSERSRTSRVASFSIVGFALASILSLAAVPPARADAPREPRTESEARDGLTADDIYERMLANRFDSSIQDMRIISGGRGSIQQGVTMRMLWKRSRDGSESEKDGVLSRSLVRYSDPTDLRDTGYLVINNRDRPNDQFVYMRSMRRTRRVNLRGETIAGTDLSLEDIIPREMEDARYERAEDEDLDGVSCFVIDAVPDREKASEYSRMRLYVEKDHYVALQTRYWNRKRKEVKVLRAELESITKVNEVWLPLRTEMKQLVDRTHTQLIVLRIVAEPELDDRYFSQRQLEASRLRIPDEVWEGGVEF
jgi:hypothetical protein